jgi:beta-glucosidase
VSVAKTSDVVVLVMGNDESTEGESRDRCDLDLPGVQEDLIEEICNVGNPVVVVLIGGSVVTMSRWIDRVQAVIEAWYPGEEGGNAIADILFGNCSPGGRLPLTFARTTGQLPLCYSFKPSGRIDDYADLRGRQPRFDFGFGLSYTTFKYSRPRLHKSSNNRHESNAVTVDVTNTGEVAGDEVVQLYIRDKVSSVARPFKELKGFRRVHLAPGETRSVTLEIKEEQLAFYDIDMRYVVEPGEFEIMVGSSSRDEDLQKVILSVKS